MWMLLLQYEKTGRVKIDRYETPAEYLLARKRAPSGWAPDGI
jgi:hypothetical protein